MQERETYDQIRNKLLDAEMQAPGFDDLFGNDLTGEDTLRKAFTSKLQAAEIQAPAFDELFSESLPVKHPAPVRKMFPWWSVAGVAAACLLMILLLPAKSPILSDKHSQATPEVQSSPVKAAKAPLKRNTLAELNSPRLQNPAPAPLKIEQPVKKHEDILSEVSKTDSGQEQSTVVEEKKSLEKIQPASQPEMEVKYSRSLENAYAEARLLKQNGHRDKPAVSFGFNSANRLLSSVNEQSENSLLFSSQRYSATNGYNRLTGEPVVSALRNYSATVNDWNYPENLNGLVLQNIETKTFMPINIGLTLSIPLVTDVNLITGLQYTYLQNKITGKASGSDFTRKQELHYLGIPVKLSYKFFYSGRFSLHVLGGGTLEKGLAGIQNCHINTPANGMNDWKNTQTISGIQTSLTGQVGVNFELSKQFVLYTEPGVAWFPASDQPISNRTEEPFNFNLSMGVRYCLH